MKKRLIAGLVTGVLMLGIAGLANATTYVEDFEAPFPTWESGWLAVNSNLQNYYGVGADRGNNPDGLWIHDGNWNDGNNAYITFDNAFGSSITSFSIDLASFISDAVLKIYDMSGNLLYNVLTAHNNGAYYEPGLYQNHSVSSSNGISGFSITGSYVEGNVGMDNVVVNTGSVPVPEPATMFLFGTGLAGLAGFRLRRKNQ